MLFRSMAFVSGFLGSLTRSSRDKRFSRLSVLSFGSSPSFDMNFYFQACSTSYPDFELDTLENILLSQVIR